MSKENGMAAIGGEQFTMEVVSRATSLARTLLEGTEAIPHPFVAVEMTARQVAHEVVEAKGLEALQRRTIAPDMLACCALDMTEQDDEMPPQPDKAVLTRAAAKLGFGHSTPDKPMVEATAHIVSRKVVEDSAIAACTLENVALNGTLLEPISQTVKVQQSTLSRQQFARAVTEQAVHIIKVTLCGTKQKPHYDKEVQVAAICVAEEALERLAESAMGENLPALQRRAAKKLGVC